jgi:hypothetical protein
MKLVCLLTAAAALALGGCSSVHSHAVRKLIDTESAKVQAANAAAKKFTDETATRAASLQSALAALDTALSQMQASEHIHAIVFGASQNLESKKGIDAHAAAYLIATTYLAQQAGLEQAVRDQFAKDISALKDQALRIAASWKSLADLQAKVQDYANKSGLSALDAEAIGAAIAQIPGASQEFDKVLAESEKVSARLDQALNSAPLGSSPAAQVRPYAAELMDLLERIKAAK